MIQNLLYILEGVEWRFELAVSELLQTAFLTLASEAEGAEASLISKCLPIASSLDNIFVIDKSLFSYLCNMGFSSIS